MGNLSQRTSGFGTAGAPGQHQADLALAELGVGLAVAAKTRRGLLYRYPADIGASKGDGRMDIYKAD